MSILLFVALILFAPALSAAPHNGLTPEGQAATSTVPALLAQACGGTPVAGGDVVSVRPTAGLGSFHSYFIEVPPGAGQLTVDIFDGDFGGTNDTIFSGNAIACYSLISPTGAVAATICTNAPFGADAAWANFATVGGPAPGHWELRVDTSDAAAVAAGVGTTTGNCYHGYAIRANAGAGGPELNVYANGNLPFGFMGGGTRTGPVFPYVTSGCTASMSDYDSDSLVNYSVTSRSANNPASPGPVTTTVATGAVSGNGNWNSSTINSWVSPSDARGYGIFSTNVTVQSLGIGNVLSLYARSDTSPGPGPGTPGITIPPAGSFRTYLPTDAGGPPQKPFLEQIARYAGAGPTTPTVGQTTLMGIDVFLANPSAHPVTFSPSNLVTTTVPTNTQAVYRGGSAAVSHGSTISEPCISGTCNTGTVSWNPGVIPAGEVAVLSYIVEVTPTVGGAIQITGNIASGGTQATYLDETANASQPQATYQHGPICPLSVSSFTATRVLITDFESYSLDGEVFVEFETGAQEGAVGFFLWRLDSSTGSYTQVGDLMLAARQGAPTGARYRMADPGARPDTEATYVLYEVDFRGAEEIYGPYSATASSAPQKQATASQRLQTFSSELSPTPKRRTGRQKDTARHEDTSLQPRRRTITNGVAKAIVETSGVYFASSEDLAAQMGMSLRSMERLIERKDLNIESAKGPEPWWPGEGGVLFFAHAEGSMYANESAYRVSAGAGLQLAKDHGGAPSALPGTSFLHTMRFEEESFAGTSVANDADEDFWFWAAFNASHPTQGRSTFDLSVPGAKAGSPGQLSISLFGASDVSPLDDHLVDLRLNGEFLGRVSFDGIGSHRAELQIPSGVLKDGSNRIEVRAHRGPEAPFSFLYLDEFELQYERRYRAAGQQIHVRSDANSVVTIDGFNEPEITVLRLDDSQSSAVAQVERVAVERTADGFGYRASFVPVGSAEPYFAYASSATQRARIEPWRTAAVPASTEYLVIAPPQFLSAGQRLALYREGTGYRTSVVNVEAIYNESNHGTPSPDAIVSFLQDLSEDPDSALQFVVLLGKGTFDYLDVQGLGNNLIPARLQATQNGLYAADNLYADLAGEDGVPELAIGRIPAQTEDQVHWYLDKLEQAELALEQSPAANWLLVADNGDKGGDFRRSSEVLANTVSRAAVADTIYLDERSLPESIGSFNAMFGQVDFVNYVGHGGLDRLTDEGLLVGDDIARLPLAQRFPLLIGVTCSISRFEVPGFRSLAESLVLEPGRGALAVWAPTGLSYNEDGQVLNKLFVSEQASGKHQTVGEAVRATLAHYAQGANLPDSVRVLTLLGDPAAKLPLAAQPELPDETEGQIP